MFDNVTKDDLIFAFFPCVRFSEQAQINFNGHSYAQTKWDDYKKLEYAKNFHDELSEFYTLVTELTMICIKKGIRLIIENPYNDQHYLVKYWPIKAKIIIRDRQKEGDYYKKPTQFFFVNCDPENNFIFEPVTYTEPKTIRLTRNKVTRSLIAPGFAYRFIKTYLLDGEVTA